MVKKGKNKCLFIVTIVAVVVAVAALVLLLIDKQPVSSELKVGDKVIIDEEGNVIADEKGNFVGEAFGGFGTLVQVTVASIDKDGKCTCFYSEWRGCVCNPSKCGICPFVG